MDEKTLNLIYALIVGKSAFAHLRGNIDIWDNVAAIETLSDIYREDLIHIIKKGAGK